MTCRARSAVRAARRWTTRSVDHQILLFCVRPTPALPQGGHPSPQRLGNKGDGHAAPGPALWGNTGAAPMIAQSGARNCIRTAAAPSQPRQRSPGRFASTSVSPCQAECLMSAAPPIRPVLPGSSAYGVSGTAVPHRLAHVGPAVPRQLRATQTPVLQSAPGRA
jgi:hypothetical protein